MHNLKREQKIRKVTLQGSLINTALLIFKFIAGILGNSSAMIADAVHSLSDFLTDIIVLIFVHISYKPQDIDHDYGHGKYETLAGSLIGIALLLVGLLIFYNGLAKVIFVIKGGVLASPGIIALVAAVLSIILKEFAYRFTVKQGKKLDSQALIANAWHHRSDAFSSIGTFVGIGGAIVLGNKFTVLDPIAGVIVSVFIIKASFSLIHNASDELLEKSLPKDVEDKIVEITLQEPQITDIHNLRTRRIGSHIAIEMHIRMPGETTLYEAHKHTVNIECELRKYFGSQTHIGIHVEPLKIQNRYIEPKK